MRGKYYGLNDLSLKFFIEEVFLKLEPNKHLCKISLKENLFDLFLKNECWLKEEWTYHLSLQESKKFINDFLTFKKNNKIDEKDKELFNKIDIKIKNMKNLDSFNEPQEKSFSLLTTAFLKNFTFDKAILILTDIFNIEFLEFLEEEILTPKNKKRFDKFFNQTCEFVKYWFFYRENPFLITSKINCFSKKPRDYIIQQLILLLNQKITNGIIKDLPLRQTFDLLKLIYDHSPDNISFVKKQISLFLKAENYYDGGLYWFLLDDLWNLFQTTSIRKEIDLEQQYHYLKKKNFNKVNWKEMPNPSIETKVFKTYIEDFILENLNFRNKHGKGLFFIFTEQNKEKKISNLITRIFKSKKLDNISQIFDQKVFYNQSFKIHETGILILIEKFNKLICVKNQYSEEYSTSLNIMIDMFIIYFKLEKEEIFKIRFFMNALRDKLINKHDNSLITKYNLLFLEISLLETILLILHNWKLRKENKTPIVLGDAIKIKETIATIDERNQKINFIKNEFISEETLNYLYFNLYATINVGGFDIRNKFIHGEINALTSSHFYSVKILFILLSTWEEIVRNAAIKYWEK